MVNPQGQLVLGNGQQAMLLNSQGLMLNPQLVNQQQANSLSQFVPQNQLITAQGQPIYLANLYNLNGNNSNRAAQLPVQTIVMASNLLPSTLIGSMTNGHQKSRKSNTKKSSSSKTSSCSKKVAITTSKKPKKQSTKGSINGNSKYVDDDSETEMYQDGMQADSDQNTDIETEEDEEEYEQDSKVVQSGKIKNAYANLEESDDEDVSDAYDEEMVHDLDLDSTSNQNGSDDEEWNVSNESMSYYDDDNFSTTSKMSSLPDLSCVKKEREKPSASYNVKGEFESES